MTALCSIKWMDRSGLLTNYWVITGLLFGLGQYITPERCSSTGLGINVRLWVQLADRPASPAAPRDLGGRAAVCGRLALNRLISCILHRLDRHQFALSFTGQSGVPASPNRRIGAAKRSAGEL